MTKNNTLAQISPDQDDVLLTKLNVAVKAANEAEASVTTAQAELVSRSKAVGLLLLEAKKLHPKVKDFEAYLKRVDGLGLSRAYDFLRLAGGRTTDEELRKEARERQRKSRATKPKTLPKPTPEPKRPEPEVSVTVTETAESAQTPKEKAAAVSAHKAAPPESLVPNTAAIKSHVEMLHTLAQNANVDGILTFTRITDKAITERFAIGDADQMTDAIIAWSAHTNLNLYMPPVIFRKDLPHSSKGKEQDVLAVLALVGDLDSDIGKKAVDLAGLPLQAPYVVETSKGNYHATYPLARALVPSEAKPIAIALSKAIGGDSGTSDISHLWRIPGTLNWPNKKKLERGRSPLPQPVTVKQAWNGERVEPAAMWEAVKGFAETAGGSAGKSKSKGSNGSTGGSTETFSDLPADLQKLIASLPYDGEDRSKTAGCVAWKLFGRGWSNDAVVALFEEYSNGIGQRYPKDKNLREEIERLRQKFNEKPTGPLPNDIITEDSAAVEFVEKHGEHLRFCHSTGSWYNWNGVYWAKDQTTIVFQWARELVRQLAQDQDERKRYITNKTSFASGVERFAKGDPKIAVTVDYWDSDQWLLGTPGGTVDLRTGLLRDSQRHDGITKITSVAPLDSGCPQWLRFLKETTADDKELIRFLQQWCGYGLTGSIREHALVFVYGPGGNGKGVFVNVVTKILGDYVATAAMDTFTASHSDKHPTDLAKLRGARLVTASETEEGRAWAESRIKQMTGGDRISARFMRQDFFEYDPQFKLTIIGNHKPVLRNVDDAAKRRFLIVPFEKKPKVPDLNLEEKLLAEAPAILQWMISGCLDWLVNGLVKPPIVVTATDEYFADQDLFAQWLGEACECDPGNNYKSATGTELFQSWRGYATSASEEPGSQKSFAGRMARHGFIAKRTMKARTFLGIRLIPKASYHEHDA